MIKIVIGAAFKFPNTCIISMIIFTYLGFIQKFYETAMSDLSFLEMLKMNI